jgi:hypothetical protein
MNELLITIVDNLLILKTNNPSENSKLILRLLEFDQMAAIYNKNDRACRAVSIGTDYVR